MIRSFIGIRLYVAIAVAMGAIACSGGSPSTTDLGSMTRASLTVQSDQFQNGQPIPAKYTADGGNLSPSISWSTPPADTKSIAMTLVDSDANGFVHWVVYNIAPDVKTLPPGLPQTDWLNTLGKAYQGKNSRKSTGYFGPQPPPGKPHHYHFHVYALDSMLTLNAGVSKVDLEKAMSGHVLAQGELVGTFESH